MPRQSNPSPMLRASAVVVASGLLLSAAALAADDAPLPIRTITLYRSGVGYFERTGKVEGEQNIQLRFETSQINDILKSLVLLDLGGGQIGAVSYGSKEPLARRLASFGVDISDDPSIHTLLSRVRGADIRLTTSEGAIEGKVLGVETRQTAIFADPPRSVNEQTVNLLTKQGIRSIAIARINALEFVDPELAEELNLALAALAEQRNENTAVVDLSFTGVGERPVVLGYVTETPVWKTSYRLVLGDSAADAPNLQGWAIVENTTDEDWTGVRLSLASGNPVGFQMDLHEPVFVTRPMVAVPTMAFARPRVYEGDLMNAAGLAKAGDSRMRIEDMRGAAFSAAPAAPVPAAQWALEAHGDDSGESAYSRDLNFNDMVNYAPAALAAAGEAGEQFRYDIAAPVSIERQRSAMLPIISAPVEGRRLSIYNAADNAEHPMRGVSFTNSSGFDLSPGPIAVYDGASYAGDAQIAYTSRGQERLLAYAVDLDVAVNGDLEQTHEVRKVRIVKGMIETTSLSRNATTYKINNRDAQRDRTLLIERPKMDDWELVSPAKPASETDTLLRFEVPIGAGETTTFEVVFERTNRTSVSVTDVNLPLLMSYSQSGKAPKAVLDAVQAAANKQGRIHELEQRDRTLSSERNEISQDQSRIRENMTRVERNSELYARWVQKLTEQETRLEQIVEERRALEANLEAARKDLSYYIANLTVE